MTHDDKAAEYLRRATIELRAARRRVRQLESDPIAVVAMACRLPAGIDTPEKLWTLLDEGAETLSEFPADRGWDLDGLFHPDPDHAGTSYVDRAGFLADAAGFDPEFFAVSPREAEAMDPQHRLLLETGWELFERAGIDPTTLRGSATGVFVGSAKFGYGEGDDGDADGYAVTGTAPAVASGRLSYTFGLEGPSLTVDTACSSSLVALHLAVDSLRKGESSLAIVGGAAVMGTPDVFVDFSRQRALAADGRSKAFGEGADGFGFSEGVSLVLLERLSQAQRLGHDVLAVVRGSAVNQDGASNGLSAPSGRAQRAVIRAALSAAQLTPDEVDAVEAHGTGTALGDPIEAGALLEVYGRDRAAEFPLWLGSVKSNLGHTQAAAGVTGLLKVVLALQHERLPATLHVERPSSHVDWTSGDVELLAEARDWPRSDRPRRAGLSAVGISGTNAHVLVEEAPVPEPAPAAESAPAAAGGAGPVPLVVSGRSADGLVAQARQVADLLRTSDVGLDDLALSLGATRAHLEHRAVVVASTRAEAERDLDRVGGPARAGHDGPIEDVHEGSARTVVFVLPGQGSQWHAMGAGLMAASPTFADAVRECDAAMQPWQDWSVADVLRGDPGAPDLDRVDVVQPALFTVMVALSRLWRSWGVEPAAVVGHSQGEIAAAHVAGALSLGDAAQLVVVRSQALRELAGRGGMVAVSLDEDAVRVRLADLDDEVSVAAVNGPRSVVVSGTPSALAAFADRCSADGVETRTIDVDYASHSVQVEQVRETLLARTADIRATSGDVPFYSTVEPGIVDGADLDADYWFRNLRQPVRLHETIERLIDAGYDAFLEVSPHPVLLPALAATVDERSADDAVLLSSLARDRGDLMSFLRAVGAAHVSGVAVDWSAATVGATTVALPTYPFRRRRFWRGSEAAASRPDPLAHEIAWVPVDLTAQPVLRGEWVVVAGGPGEQERLASVTAALEAAGATTRALTLADVEAAEPHGPGEPSGVLLLLPQASASASATAELVRATLASLAQAQVEAPLWCLSSGAVSVADTDPVARPEQAAALGVGHVARLELGDRWGGTIDLPSLVEPADARLLAAALTQDREAVVAIRDGEVLGRRLRRSTASRAARPWRPRGTVLVTGAASPVGARLTDWVARHGADRLVLAGRPPSEDLLRELSAHDVEVQTCSIDLESLRTAVGSGELTALVHAEADPGFERLDDVDPDEFRRTVDARAALPELLDDLLAGSRLERELYCSSVAGTWGGARMGAYAAGSAFLDAVAARRRADGHDATVVDWTPWELPAGHDAAPDLRGSGLRSLSVPRALRSWAAAVAVDAAGVLVADAAWDDVAAGFSAVRPTALFDELVDQQGGAPTAADPAAVAVSEEAAALLALSAEQRADALLELVSAAVADALGQDDARRISAGRALRDQGLDSLGSLALRRGLTVRTGLTLPASLVYDHPTVGALAAHLGALLVPDEAEAPGGPVTQVLDDEPIAIIGIGCRFPGGVSSPDDLWDMLRAGEDATGDFPIDRGWDVASLYHPDPDHAGTSYVDKGGFLDDVAGFDPAFFGITPREALAMDPQQRLVLETTWEAMERAGIDPDTVRGSDAGVFLGMNGQSYLGLLADEGDRVEGYKGLGNSASVLSGRIAYTFGWVGPALTVDTACSASLVAVHLAAQALRRGECSMALAGGVTVMTDPYTFVDFSSQRGLAHDGRCKSFSADADGFALSDGVATLLMEPLSRARELGHPVLGVVRGSAVNQDGASNGLAAPSGPSQERVIRQALAAAGLSTTDVDVVEAHGTGTQLGDPIEAGALLATYGRDRHEPVHLGSVKSNIGHTQAAAGAAGIIKVLLSLRHGLLPRTLHAEQPSEHIDWAAGRLQLTREEVAWPGGGRPRRAGVSSFGVSGTNAHLIIEEPPAQEPVVAPSGGPDVEAPVVPLLLSARSRDAVRASAADLADLVDLADGAAPDLADVALTLSAGRCAMEWRAAVVAGDQAEAVDGLRAVVSGAPSAAVEGPGQARHRKVVLVFPGQGSQWTGMARDLLASSPTFRTALEACRDALAPHVDWDLVEVLEGRADVDPDRVDVLQAVLFSVMVSLARTWQAHGVVPSAVVGHSQGEIAAACVAGALSLEEAARVVALRAKALLAIDGDGAMVSVVASAAEVEPLVSRLDGRIGVAAVNGPRSVVLAGPAGAARELEALAAEQGLKATRIAVGYGSHSVEVERVRADVESSLGRVDATTSRVALYSTLAGERIDTATMDAGYWYRNLRETVRFDQAVGALLDDGHDLFIEVSPHPVLLPSIEERAEDREADVALVPTLRRDREGPRELVRALGQVFVLGLDVDATATVPHARRVELPTYPFERQRYWPTSAGRRAAAPAAAGLPGLGHPLLSAAVEVPGTGGLVLAGRLDADEQPWIAEHVVEGRRLVPGTVLVDLALAAGAHVGAGLLEELVLHEPLVVPDGSALLLRVTVGAASDGRRDIEVHAAPEAADGPTAWTAYASGTVATPDESAQVAAVSTTWPPPGLTPIDLDGHYERLADLGYEYGEPFRGLVAAWQGDGIVAAEVALEPARPGHVVDPVLLDVVAQSLSLRDAAAGQLPFAWNGVRLHAAVPSRLRVVASGEPGRDPSLSVTDASGALVATVDALVVRDSDSAAGLEDGLLHVVDWQPAPAPPEKETSVVEVTPGQLADPAASAGADVVVVAHDDDERDSGTAARRGVAWAAGIVRDWMAHDRGSSVLAVSTRGAVRAVPDDEPTRPAATAVWGVLRAAQSESPGRFLLVDGDASAVTPSAQTPQLAVRDAVALVPRLVAARPSLQPGPGERVAPGAGSTDSLVLAPVEDDELTPGPGEVRVSVQATGVNFRDVMLALGLYPDADAPMGTEAAGVVDAVGPDVTEVAVGDSVLGLFAGAYATQAVTDARLVVALPDGWDMPSAAAVPIAWTTAYHALHDLAGLRAGQTVLVHAAAGGVGLAAVALARHAGAEVFATASPAKHDLLRSLGLDDAHLGSSRESGFGEAFRQATGGHGVDVVLNSLTGDLLDETVALVAPGGVLVEMGKADLRDASDVACRYVPFDLGDAGPDRLGEILREVVGGLATGALRTGPVTARPLALVRETLQEMSRGDHVGKLVLTQPAPPAAEGTVLVVGGLGTVGALVARHLVTRAGVRHLVLVGRRGPDAPGASEVVADLEALGASVRAVACDATDRAALAEVLDSIPDEHPLTGVVHAAGVLADSLVATIDDASTASVVAAKVDVARHLDELTSTDDLAFFWLFSSAASVLAGPGQGVYAAANAVLESVAQDRRGRGLTATAYGWGLWASTSELTRGLEEDIARTGVAPLRTDRALDLLDEGQRSGEAVVYPVALDVAALATAELVPEVLSAMVAAPRHRAPEEAETSGGPGHELVEALSGLEPARQREVVLDLVRAHAAAVAGFSSAAQLPPGRAFRDLGFDSLAAVELRNRLTQATSVRLPSTLVFDHPTPEEVADRLLGDLAPPSAEVDLDVTGQLDGLERVLVGGGDEVLSADVGERLQRILDAWNARRPAAGAAGAASVVDDDTTDDELFSMLDERFGLEEEPRP